MNIVIIGATQGLGLELVKKFLAEGHRVAAGVPERSTPAALSELRAEFGDNLLVFQSDVTDEAEVDRSSGLCKEFFGEVDALCNVAGVLLPGDRVNKIHECDVSELRKSFDVNVIGAIIVAKAFYPVMKRDGMVITVTSEGIGVYNCGSWIPCYALSKMAATKVSGVFNASVDDVDFFSIHPGRMNTEMGKTSAQIEASESAEGLYEIMTGSKPVSRDTYYVDYKGEPLPV